MLSLIPTHSSTIHESYPRIYFMLRYIQVNHHTIILNQNRSFRKHQTSKSQHCLAQHLAQAEGSRSGETCSLRRASPSPRREHKNKSRSNAGSRLSEIPLAWASCLLAQKLSESPGRPFVQKLRRASLFHLA